MEVCIMRIGQENESFHIKKEILRHNLRKISLISKITIVILTFMVISQIVLQRFYGNYFNVELAFKVTPYIFLILFNLVVLYFTDVAKFQLKTEHFRRTERYINGYIAVLFSFGVIITLVDKVVYNQLMVYTIITVICSSFFVLNKNQVKWPLLLAGAFISIGLYVKDSANQVFFEQVLYIVTVMLVCQILSAAFYRSFIESARIKSDLIREIDFGRKISRELREANRKLGLQASHDPLTKLFNRRALNEYVSELGNRAESTPLEVTAIMLDIDCFKLYNDYYGHMKGDLVLKEMGLVLSELAEHYGFFTARWGGEEFTLLIVDESERKIKTICEAIIHSVHMLQIEHSASTVDKVVTVSIGAKSVKVQDVQDIQQCIEAADDALYEVKKNGRNGYLMITENF